MIERAAHRRDTGGGRTVLFLDEIHRFNKAQQDALLPAVEEGLLTLIGATTENPAFEVNGALLSRLRVYALQRAHRRGGRRPCCAAQPAPRSRSTTDALEFLAARSEGDARTALNALELAVATAAELGEAARRALARVEDALQRRAVLYDKGGDRHYDYISAWIKATRGSDPDASLYYLAVMLEGGEDPRFIVRRMVILASEDIGNADPARAVAGHRGGARRSSTWACRRRATRSRRPRSTWRSRPSPTPPGARWRPPSAHVREHGAAPVPAVAALRAAAGPRAGRAAAMRTRTGTPGTSRPGAAARGRRRRALLRARRGRGGAGRAPRARSARRAGRERAIIAPTARRRAAIIARA